jgi:hypothetical protein
MRRPPSWPFWLSLVLTATLSNTAVLAAVPHKLQLNDPVLAGEVTANGGHLLADYGGYQLYEIPAIPPTLATNAQVTIRDDDNSILLNAARLDSSRQQVRALRHPLGTFSGKRLHLIQFIGPVQPAWYQALLDSGAQVVASVPHNAYLLYGDASALGKVQALAAAADFVQWEGPFADDYKLHPAARNTDAKGRPRSIGTDRFAIQLITEPDGNISTLQLLDRLKLEPFKPPQSVLRYRNIFVRLSPDSLALIAARPDVVSIQPFFTPRKFDERQDQIIAANLSGTVPSGPGYLAWLASKGFTQAQFTSSGFIVDLSDSGIDNGTNSPNHLGLHVNGALANPSRVAYNRLEGSPNGGSTLAGCDGHGTLNAHVVAGFNALSGFPHTDAAGFHYGLGVCPFVEVGSSVIFDPDSFTFPDFNNLQSEAYQSGARISNNSWGGLGNGLYDAYAQNFDALARDAQPDGSTYATSGNQEMVLVCSAGNDGPVPQSAGSPGLAKNVIGVGAAANVQLFGAGDGCGQPDAGAENANDVCSFSSRGPCADGRHKPDLVAPGTHISGGVVQVPNPGPNGTADPCFLSNGQGICGGTNGDLFWPSGQEFYTASSGTSHAAPAVAGACALVRQYFINNLANPPSPAMTKAFLMNSARYLTGLAGNDNLWSDAQGMGELNLGMAFDGTPRMVRDELSSDLFTNSGQVRVFSGTISDTNKPFRVTLAWTDAPGDQFATAYKNNLDLVVSAGGRTYLGNVFNGAFSTTGGAADGANNVESVFLPAGLSGTFSVRIIATDINSDGVPGNASPLDQDFALVVYNASSSISPLPVLGAAGTTLVSESCSPANAAVDPGETVTLNFALQNLGGASSTNLVATLLASGGVLAPGGPQSYGVLAPAGPLVSRPFSFTAQGVCGGAITATLQLQDGTTPLGYARFDIPLGQTQPFTVFAENFDSVTAPALPPNWTTSTTGGGSPWTTTTTTADTSPNSASAPDADTSGVAELISPVIHITSPVAQLSFSNYYNLEGDTYGQAVYAAYDGGVLEIKIGTGAFTDILTAGGTFVAGGYVCRIYTTGNNPLADRPAWSGDSGGFISTVVNLPPAAAGQNVQFKWRLGTDLNNTFGGVAWYIDTLTVRDANYSCCTSSVSPPTLTGITVTRSNVTVTSTSSAGGHYTLQYKNALSDSQWLPLTTPIPGTGNPISLIDTNAPGPRRFYRVLAN